jgi:non-specific serine/threonine protein kinase
MAIRDRPDRSIGTALCEDLARKSLLIVLDNCEQVIDACASLVQRLLATGPEVAVLATSRETLGVPGEVVCALRTLSVPDPRRQDVVSIARAESVRLFLQRAAAACPGFEADERDSPPSPRSAAASMASALAIRARGRASPAPCPRLRIAERLDDRFRLLTGGSRGAVPRSGRSRRLCAWSYDLLSEGRAAPVQSPLGVSELVESVGAERVCADSRLPAG